MTLRTGTYDAVNAIALRLGAGRLKWWLAPTIRELWRRLDRSGASPTITSLIDAAPKTLWGGVGGDSYTAWVYQQGFLAALIRGLAPEGSLRILDFGCGYGKLAPISVPLTYPSGEYLGVDMLSHCIAACREQYSALPRARFQLVSGQNPTYLGNDYAPSPRGARAAIDGDSWDPAASREWFDVAIAVSVFTHLQEDDARRHAAELRAALKPGGFLVVTMFVVGDKESDRSGLRPLQPSGEFFTVHERPEDWIGLSERGIQILLGDNFKLHSLIRRNYFDGYALFPQDILVAERR